MSGLYWTLPAALALVLAPQVWALEPPSALRTYATAWVEIAVGGATLHYAYQGLVLPRLRRGVSVTAGASLHVFGIALAVTAGMVVSLALQGVGATMDGFVRKLYAAVLTGTLFVYLSLSIGRAYRTSQRAELEAAEQRAASARASLRALAAQISPHFLFNALNGAAQLATTDPQRAVTALENLAELLRYTIQVSAHAEVDLLEEVRIVRRFLSLQGMRFPEVDTIRIDVEGVALSAWRIPPLAIQALVENVVAHGRCPSTRTIDARVSVTASFEAMRVEVSNVVAEGAREAGTGTALDSLRGRLALTYGERARLTARRIGDRFEAIIEIRRSAVQ